MLRSLLAFPWVLVLCLSSPLENTQAARPGGVQCVWPGWMNIKHMVTFGDSYTATGFSASSTHPSDGNPFGNPPYPGRTASNGANWLDFLSTKYNASVIQVANFASVGATVDSAIVPPYKSSVASLRQQVEDQFLTNYSWSDYFPWRADDTLFGIWIGINDVDGSYRKQNATFNSLVFDVYSEMVDKLCQAGARSFLFINVPTIDKSPLFTEQGDWATSHLRADIKDFNTRVISLASSVTSRHRNAKTWVFDSNMLFDRALSNPCSYPQTCAIQNTVSFCGSNADGPIEIAKRDTGCGVSVDDYFWLNTLHPTTRVHDVVASQISSTASILGTL